MHIKTYTQNVISNYVSTSPAPASQAHLTRDTLYHRLALLLRVVLPPASTKHPSEVPPVLVFLVYGLFSSMERARVREPARGAVAPERAFGEELELLVVGVARDAAC